MTEARREYWADLIAEQEGCGLSVRRFCGERGVCAASFYQWRKRLRSAEATVGFALVETMPAGPAAMSESALELIFANGERLRIPYGFDDGALRLALSAIRG